jgi:hypothetical protein
MSRLTHRQVTVATAVVISAFPDARAAGRRYDFRVFTAFALFFAFGMLCTTGFAHFTPHQIGAFWPIYYMLIYTIVGLWVGWAFVVIGLGITVLTLVGYFFIGAWFDLWMAAVNGGGLILGGLWMRRS